MATPVPRRQRQGGQVPDRAVRAQHRVRELAQLIGAAGQAGMELAAEPRQHGERVARYGFSGKLSITAYVIMVLWREHMITRRPYSRTATRRDHPEETVRKTPATATRLNGS